MSRTTQRWMLAGTTAAVIAIGALAAGPATAATVTGTATLTATPTSAAVATDAASHLVGAGGGTVTVDGDAYTGLSASGSNVGVYVVYGPKQADFNLNSGWYHDMAWITPATIAAGGGSFSVDLDIAQSYTANPYHADVPLDVDCAYDESLSAAANAANGDYKCFVQTFTAHGQPINAGETLAIEVKW